MPIKKPLALSKKEVENDPLNVTPRLYQQVGRLLEQLEEQDIVIDKDTQGVTIPQRISALIAAGRIMKMMQDLRKGSLDVGAGSAIDKYAAAFTSPDATGGREPRARSRPAIEFDEPEPGDPDYDSAA